ncbi:MAG: GntP family permease, partial [Cyclobacteriaceae bacterium]|nr:GntP family permease [Cyclobacteriaceae bacterium]
VGQAASVPASTMTLGLAGGLYTTHTLVPPTPGPMNAAANLGAGDSLGLVILLGLVVSLPVSLIAFFYARYIGSKITAVNPGTETIVAKPAPISLTTPLVLIFLPVLLIACGSVLELTNAAFTGVHLLRFLGQPLVSLLLTVALGLGIFRHRHQTLLWVEKGIRQAGPIVLLTGCGGAFGAVLGASPLASILSVWIAAQAVGGVAFLVVCFGVSALFKSAQGSSTSAMLIVSSVAYPLAASAGFTDPVELSLLVLAIGAGAMTVSHANDSYFWVVSQFGGLEVKAAYLGWTIMTFLQGLTALLVVLVLYLALV